MKSIGSVLPSKRGEVEFLEPWGPVQITRGFFTAAAAVVRRGRLVLHGGQVGFHGGQLRLERLHHLHEVLEGRFSHVGGVGGGSSGRGRGWRGAGAGGRGSKRHRYQVVKRLSAQRRRTAAT